MFFLWSKLYCCYDVVAKKFKLNSKFSKKCVLNQRGDCSLEKYRRVPDEKFFIMLTNRIFRADSFTVRKNKWRNDTPISIQKDLKRVIESTLNLSYCKLNN